MSDEIQHSEFEYNQQSTYLHFDLSVLELYRNDPRYQLTENDEGGRISIKPSYFEAHPEEQEELLVDLNFGFAYDVYQDHKKTVAVSPRNFLQMSPTNQNLWNEKRVTGISPRVDREHTNIAIGGKWGRRDRRLQDD